MPTPQQEQDTLRQAYAAARQHLKSLQTQGLAPFTVLAPSREVFLDTEVEGHRLRGAIGNFGPYLERIDPHGHAQSSYFGPSVIHDLPVGNLRAGRAHEGYWVCKYEPSQPHIDLSMLSPAGMRRVAFEFGLPVEGVEPERQRFGGDMAFFASNAFKALQEWALKHPRKAQWTSQGGLYLKGWAEPDPTHPGSEDGPSCC